MSRYRSNPYLGNSNLRGGPYNDEGGPFPRGYKEPSPDKEALGKEPSTLGANPSEGVNRDKALALFGGAPLEDIRPPLAENPPIYLSIRLPFRPRKGSKTYLLRTEAKVASSLFHRALARNTWFGYLVDYAWDTTVTEKSLTKNIRLNFSPRDPSLESISLLDNLRLAYWILRCRK